MADRYLDGCVVCGQPAIECCVWREGRHFGGTERDYCADCIEAGEDDCHFGRCYVCRHFGDHERCIGVPCQCPCPTPDQRRRQELRAQALAKLTLDEQQALGVSA